MEPGEEEKTSRTTKAGQAGKQNLIYSIQHTAAKWGFLYNLINLQNVL